MITITETKRLYRSRTDRKIAGVCGGFAEYLNVDPAILRIVWAVSILLFGVGIFLYLLAWIITPENPNN